MHQTTAVNDALSSDGYFFSPLPFNQTEQIEALQLAIVLGVNEEVDAETILIAHCGIDHNDYQLAIVGQLQIVDSQGNLVDAQSLREQPIEQLSETQISARGWKVVSRPYFIWLKGTTPLDRSRSNCIFANVGDQLRTLQTLM